MTRTEWDILVHFKSGASFRTARMTEAEATTLFASLNPTTAGNENIKEIQLYRHDISEDTSFIKRLPMWSAV